MIQNCFVYLAKYSNLSHRILISNRLTHLCDVFRLYFVLHLFKINITRLDNESNALTNILKVVVFFVFLGSQIVLTALAVELIL